MNKTKIEWCDSTWNPVTGCLHGCEYCYARRIARRFCHDPWNTAEDGINHYVGIPMQNEHYKGGRIDPYPYGFDPTFHRYRLGEPARKKQPQNIFVCSMADLFGEWVPDEWIQEIFAACEAAPWHRYLFLTKNPERLCSLANDNLLPEKDCFWWGSTVTGKSSKRFQGRLRHRMFISIEPLLEPLDADLGSFGAANWIILGAETGNRRGKNIPKRDWVENILEAAAITQIPVFMKDSMIPIMGEENMRREFPWEESI